MISNLFGPMVSIVLIVFFAIIVFLYIISIAWTMKDAKARGASKSVYKWLSIIPFVGVLAYILLRPPLYSIDLKEQELDIKLKTRQLEYYGKCPSCGTAVTADYLVCPVCKNKLKESCINCGKALESKWIACPYCGTSAGSEQAFSAHRSDISKTEYSTTRTKNTSKKDK